MSKKDETKFGELIDSQLKKLFGTDVWIENIQQVGKRGTPDRLICLSGFFIALELKTDTGVLESLQVRKLLKINKAGGVGVVATPTNWAFIREFLVKLHKKAAQTAAKTAQKSTKIH